MAKWRITGQGIAGPAEGKSFEILLNTDDNSWTASGSSVALFLSATAGKYKIIGLPEQGAQMVTPQGQEIAFLARLSGNSAIGAAGNGRTELEKITWKLNNK